MPTRYQRSTKRSAPAPARVEPRAEGRASRPAAPSGFVTGFRAKPSDPSLVEVIVDDAPLGTALRSELDRLGVREGIRLSATRRRALLEAFERAKARTVALKALGRSDRSRSSLVRELTERHGVEERVARSIVEDLARDGWQDDDRFAAQRAASLVERRGASASLIEATLAADGVEEAIAKRAARRAAPRATERQRASEIAAALLGKRGTGSPTRRGGEAGPKRAASAESAGRAANRPTLADARRVARQLAQRGYEADTILAALAASGVDLSPMDDVD